MINERDFEGITPLHIACFFGHVHLVIYLLNNGAQIRWKDNSGHTALHWACIIGSIPIALNLISFEINAFRERYCFNNHGVIALAHMTRNSAVHDKNNLGNTCLHHACYYNHIELCLLLIEKVRR